MVARHGALPPELAVPAVRRVARTLADAQAAGHYADTKSQVFWLGAVLFFALTGKAPLESEATSRAGERTATAAPSPSAFSPHRIPSALDAVVRTCLASLPSERFGSVKELHVALTALRYEDVATDAGVGWGEPTEDFNRATPPPDSGVVRRGDSEQRQPALRLVRTG